MFTDLSTLALIGVLLAAGAVVLLVSIRATTLADTIADRAGWGEAIVGGALLGGATSLSGLTVSVSSAWAGDASLAFSNGVGGIAAQTLFLAVADIAHRRANLEHAAAEPVNLIQGVQLLALLTLPLVAWSAPPFAVFGVHPVTALLIGGYVYGLVVAREVHARPLWEPVETDATRHDEPDDDGARGSLLWLGVQFGALALALAVSGWVIAQAAGVVVTRFGISATLVGALLTAVLTSLPELVTTLAAVRRGALQLAVGGIIGGNTFDTLFLAASDVAYRDGSLFHAVERGDLFWLSTGVLMTAVVLFGQIRREPQGPASIGFESMALIVIYAVAVVLQAVAG